jgi:hypothetical protein
MKPGHDAFAPGGTAWKRLSGGSPSAARNAAMAEGTAKPDTAG